MPATRSSYLQSARHETGTSATLAVSWLTVQAFMPGQARAHSCDTAG